MTENTTGTTTSAQIATITPDLTVIDGKVTTTSTQVAQHFGKRHDTVLRAIDNLECSAEFRLRNFAESSVVGEMPNGGTREYRIFRITRQGFSFLAMGFTGKEAAQWKEAYLETFDRMEAALTSQASDKITPAQCQHLRELVQLVVDSGKQGNGETWNRLHRKMKVNSYKELTPEKFDAAVDYLRSKMDDTSIAAIAQKHFPQIAQLTYKEQPVQTIEPPSIKNRRWMISFDHLGNEVAQPVPHDCGVLSPTSSDDVHAFIDHMIPLRLLPEVINTANQRIARNFPALRALPA